MSGNFEVREGLRLLNGLENGSLTSADAYTIADQRDPVLIYFILRYLREKYPPSKPASQGVLQRVVELTSTYDDIVKKAKVGEHDSMREWFDDAYAMRDYFDRGQELIEMLVDKLES